VLDNFNEIGMSIHQVYCQILPNRKLI